VSPARWITYLRAAIVLTWRTAPLGLLAYLALTAVGAATPVVAAWFLKSVLDRMPHTGADMARMAVGLAITGVVAAVIPHAAAFLDADLARRVGLFAKDRLYRAVERFVGLGRFEDPGFLDRLRMAEEAARTTPNRIVDGTLTTARNLLTAVGFVGSLAVLSPLMTGIVVAAAVPALVAELRLSRHRARTMWDVSPAERREIFYAQLLTSLAAAKEIRLFGTGGFLRGRMLRERRTADVRLRRSDLVRLVTHTGLGGLSALVAGAGLVLALRGAFTGQLTPGDVAMFVAAVAGVQAALATGVATLADTYHAMLLYEHYDRVLSEEPDLQLPSRPRPVPPLRRGITLHDVWFRYSDEQPWSLREVNLHIPSGSAMALVGRNGARKSTLVKLLCRFYDPTRGVITWDGIDLRDLDPAEFRARIGAVFQDFMSYDLTAQENIGLGDVRRLDNRVDVLAAARLAGAHDTIAALPRGYDTVLSRIFAAESDAPDASASGGLLLSGGQWQRLALARALFRADVDLMILDEPSSGLDAEAEHEIHARLADHRRGRTSLLISHRLGAVRDADTIVVLDGGQVTEIGDHETLIARGGLYARLFELQAAGYERDSRGAGLLAGGHDTEGGIG
jgi:ATP-binding cassette, subfamily B, bacterial